ncbi:MAG TPA: VCBS repeat-containing protein, partial [Polyangiaceae bacterium]|nr:VCBS repeat-containing protein [Polyangiaceae bacterium]
DGKLDIVSNRNLHLWLQGSTPTEWQLVELHALSDAEGLAVGKVDADDLPDFVVRGYWVRTPADPTNPDAYQRYEIDANVSDSVVLRVADIDQNGTPDVVVAPKEDNISEIDWYSADDPTQGWTKHTIGPAGFAHEFVVVDFDGNGRPDIVFAEMSPSPTMRVGAYLQQDSGEWVYFPIATTGSHNIVVGDLGNDCDFDVLGANWEAPPVQIWENHLCDGSGRSCPSSQLDGQ